MPTIAAIIAIINVVESLMPEASGLAALVEKNATGQPFTDVELAQLDTIAQALNAKAETAAAAALAAPGPQ